MSNAHFDISVELPPEIDALGRSLRELIHQMLAVDTVPDELSAELRHLRERIEAVSARVARHARSDRMPRFAHEGGSPSRPYYVKGALIGEHNPLAPLFEIGHADGVTSGTVRFRAGHEGPPGCVHGGFVAFFFDQILGHHNVACEIPAMTGTLKVRYRQPTPLLTDMRFEVRTAHITDRKVINEAWLDAEGERVGEAEGVFVRPQADNYMGHMGKALTEKS